MKLLVATRNKKKLGELARLLEGAGVEGVELLSIDDVDEYPERPEDGRTFEANALIKAHDGADATGLPCLADDSGLSVDELNGMPGVLSARWSGGHGGGTGGADRAGSATGGRALGERRGGQRQRDEEEERLDERAGVHRVDELGADARTAAQLTSDEKDAISHRGRALRQLVPELARLARTLG